jgi:hypothetical protein
VVLLLLFLFLLLLYISLLLLISLLIGLFSTQRQLLDYIYAGFFSLQFRPHPPSSGRYLSSLFILSSLMCYCLTSHTSTFSPDYILPFLHTCMHFSPFYNEVHTISLFRFGMNCDRNKLFHSLWTAQLRNILAL